MLANPFMLLVGLLSIFFTVAISLLPGGDLGEQLTLNTIRVSMLWYALAMGLLLVNRRKPIPQSLRRWCWTWGMILFVIHVAMAFQYYHHWSHALAFDATGRASGVGEGVYVSYLFTLVWLLDVVWWWVQPDGYMRRSKRWGRIIHLFMLLVIFNGVVVFESGPTRWVGAAIFVGLAGLGYVSVRPAKSHSIEQLAP